MSDKGALNMLAGGDVSGSDSGSGSYEAVSSAVQLRLTAGPFRIFADIQTVNRHIGGR
ncbi:hypothetical protein ACJJIE_06270 [Microbulbifer sp. TRSA001]|uniref:hypothetical protein n=1 Tax=Microbulbifer sp. TRSA001 TaxID=3243381 RepID=UPI00403A23C0